MVKISDKSDYSRFVRPDGGFGTGGGELARRLQ